MANSKNPEESGEITGTRSSPTPPSREEKLARQLRDNLAKRKSQSRARKTKPRKFKNQAG